MKISKSGKEYDILKTDDIYDILPVKNYIIMSQISRGYFLQEKEEFRLPKKIYGKDTHFIDKVKKTYDNLSDRDTLGILLNGLKGTGKTVDATMIALQSNLPVLFVTASYCDTDFKNFLSSITQEYVLFIDEFEKIYNYEHQEQLLSVFDGMLSSKKIILLTSNNDRISEFFNNRLKRIRYRKTYHNLSESVIKEVIEDLLNNKSYIPELLNKIADIGIITMDILISIIEEMNIHNETVEEATKYLNIISEKVEYRLGRLLPNDEYLFIDTFKASADSGFFQYEGHYKPHITESNVKNQHIYYDIDSKVINPEKIKYNTYKMVVPTTFTVLKDDNNYQEERDITYIIEKESIYKFGY
jgi:SpoVK/Ycf46/Vps4 family AAA+-type ATPase